MARRAALLNQGMTTLPTRRQALLKKMGVAKRIPTPFYNKKGRQFFLTMKGKYVVRQNGKSLYGRKATNPMAPLAIRPKIRVMRTPESHRLRTPTTKAKHVRRVKARSPNRN
jgi:hypothetical protein